VDGVLTTAFSDLMTLLYVRSNVQPIHSIIGLVFVIYEVFTFASLKSHSIQDEL